MQVPRFDGGVVQAVAFVKWVELDILISNRDLLLPGHAHGDLF